MSVQSPILCESMSSNRNAGEMLLTLDNIPGFHNVPDPFGPAGMAKNIHTREVEHTDVDAHKRGALLPVYTVIAIAKGIASIEPASEAERATATKSEVLVP